MGTYASVVLAQIEARMGADASCRSRVDHALREAAPAGAGVVTTMANAALASLEQTLGNHEQAFARLLANAEDEKRRGLRNPLITPTLIGLVETSVQLGHPELAAPYQAEIEEAAEILRSPSVSALAAFGRALLASRDSYRDAFEEALEWHERGGRRFDWARTQLGYGERLRRDRHRAESRRLLRAAIERFDEIGSAPWADRARRELQATGETTHPRVASSRDLLTPQELQVARLTAEGLSNNEIAARLFISPRTVEKHLGQTFRKLDISSRRGLILAGTELLGV
jgi:DNA-binding CsgD family transcriptional regulator